MQRLPWVLIVSACVMASACKKERPVQAEPLPAKPAIDVRAEGSLVVTEKDGAFELSDGAKRMRITLPQRPTVTGELVSQAGAEVFHAQAVMPGGDVDVQVAIMTVPDGVLPPQLVGVLAETPNQLAAATGGTVDKNEVAQLAGLSGRSFELKTGDTRRLFGWFASSGTQARIYQVNCVGEDTAVTRTACETIARSMTVTN